jgi:hypothetical protein
MPLFDWVDALAFLDWGPGSPSTIIRREIDRFEADVDDPTAGPLSRDRQELARLEAQRWESDRDQGSKLARSRWLEANDAERTFSCGVVPDPVLAETDPGRTRSREEPPRPLLPSDPGWAAPQRTVETGPPAEPQPLTPLRPMHVIAAVLPNDLVFIREQGEDEEVDEVGRLPRGAIRDVDVVDEHGSHVPEPTHETIEPSPVVFMLLRWSNEGVNDEDRFAFRSPWLAWRAGRKLLEARKG